MAVSERPDHRRWDVLRLRISSLVKAKDEGVRDGQIIGLVGEKRIRRRKIFRVLWD